MIAKCQQCEQFKELTHRVESDVLKMLVCYSCGVSAEIVQGRQAGGAGAMRITLFESPKVVPIWFECSVCGAHLRNEHHYQDHWYENHC